MDAETREELWKALVESGTLSKEKLRASRKILTEEPETDNVADQLHELGVISNYQAKKLKIHRLGELTFGQYFIQEKLGEGGMGKVYKAVQRGAGGRIVAIKVVRPHLMSNKTVLKRYQREAAAVAKLDHPNIVCLYDVNDINGRYFLAMEYIDGIDLSRMVKEFGKPPERGLPQHQEACEYIRQAALGLAHAHERGLVHRDVKPSNILVYGDRALPGSSGEAKVKVLDMGLVRSLSDDDDVSRTELTRDGTVVGTPDYMAPEQAKNSSTVDGRADIYSLGCTLFFMLAGRVLYPDGSPIEKLLKHQVESPPDLSRIRPDLPNGLIRLWLKMIEKDPTKRYQTCAEVAKALTPYTLLGELDTDTSEIATFSLAPETPMSEIGLSPQADTIPAAEVVAPPPVAPTTASTSSANSSPSTRVSPRPAPTTRKLPPTPLQKSVKTATARAAVPGAMSVPPAESQPSNESLPTGPGAAKTSRTPPRVLDETPPSTERRRDRLNRKPKRSPLMVPLLVGGGILGVMLLVVVGLVVFSSKSPSAPTTAETRATTPTVATSTPTPTYELAELLPDQTTAVMVLHPRNYFGQQAYAGENKNSPKGMKYIKLLNQKMRLDPRDCKRLTIPFVGTQNQWLMIGEGDFLKSDWEQGFTGYPDMQRGQLAGQKSFQNLKWSTGPNHGLILPGTAYLVGHDPKLLAGLAERVKQNRKAQAVAPSLIDQVPEISKLNDADVIFAASDKFPLPDGKTLGEHGANRLLLKLKLDNDKVKLQLDLYGNNKTKIQDFQSQYLGSEIPSKYTSTNGLVNSILRQLAEPSIQTQTNGTLLLHYSGVIDWPEFQQGFERILPDPDPRD